MSKHLRSADEAYTIAQQTMERKASEQLAHVIDSIEESIQYPNGYGSIVIRGNLLRIVENKLISEGYKISNITSKTFRVHWGFPR